MENEMDWRVPLGQRQLFLDEHGIAEIAALTRTLHQPDKRGAVIRSANPSQTVQTRTAPVWAPEEEVFKFWVTGTDQPYRTSPDGLHWTPGPRPNLGFSAAVRDPNDPDPQQRYKAALGNRGFAVSPDGICWTELDVPAIPSQDEWNFSYNPQAGLFIHAVKRFGRQV